MFDSIEKEEIKNFLNNTQGTIYIGCDSQPVSNDFAKYTSVMIVHINNNHGCKMFGYTHHERIYDSQRKPRMRLMTEAYKAAELYLEFEDLLVDRDVEIHLDINTKENHMSHIVSNEAAGYIQGVCGIYPKLKPNSWAASRCADYVVRRKIKEEALRIAQEHASQM